MNYFNEMISSIKDLVKIDSVEKPATGDKPFGQGVYDALKYMLDLGEKFGFESINYDNYIGEIVWRGGEENLGILCHLDVVPVGNLSDWKYPPFSATEVDGKIYGRGTMDDKSPAVCILYCMKQLKDEGFKPKKTIKLILGCDEESGWECIAHYKKVAKMPETGFSPDADFPVLYAEKGILHAEFTFDASDKLKEIIGGVRANVVCDYVRCLAPTDKNLIKKYGLETDGDYIVGRGITAHGSTPEKGKNAIEPMLKYLADLGIIDKEVPQKLFDDVLGLKKLEDETGKLTMSPDVIEGKEGKIKIIVDFRYPCTLKPDFMLETIAKIGKYTVLEHQLPLYNDKNSDMIQTLLKIYNETTGENAQPIAIGGGTYARALPVGTAFGPQFMGEEETIHQPNEYIKIENLKLCYEMYKKAVYELSK